MAGIEKLKAAVSVGIRLTEGVLEKLDDKKLTWLEVLGLAPILVDLPALIRDADALYDELQDLTEKENQELLAYVKEEFDVDNDNLEEVVEDALSVVSALGTLAFSIKALKEE